MGAHPELKLPTNGFVPNQHRRRVSLPASPPETPANFTGFFPKGAGTFPVHLGASNTFTFPISPPATPTRPQTLANDALPTHTHHQRLPSYDEKLRRASWAPHHRRLSTTSLLHMVTHTTRPLLTPTKLATFLLILLSGTYLFSLVAFPSRIAPIAKPSPPALMRATAAPARPVRPVAQRFGKAGNRHLSDERERQRWAEDLPAHMPHQIHIVDVDDKADPELQHDVLREHPESFQGERPAMRLKPGQVDIEEDEAAIAEQSAEPAPKPAFYVGGKPVYKQRQTGPARVQIGKAAEAPAIPIINEDNDEVEDEEYTEAAEAQEAERLEDSGISMPAGGGEVERVEAVEAEAVSEPEEQEEEVEEKVVPVKAASAKKPIAKPLGRKPATIKRPVVPVVAPPPPVAAAVIEPPPRQPHEAEVAREKILAGLGARPQGQRAGAGGNSQKESIRQMVKQIKAAQAGRGSRGSLDSSAPYVAPDLEKDPRDSKRKVMKNPVGRRKGAGKARVAKEVDGPDHPDYVAAAVKKASHQPAAEEWRNINGDEDEGDEVSYRR